MTMTDAVRPRDEARAVEDVLGFTTAPIRTGTRLAGFFPGLGSRAHYRDVGDRLASSRSPEVAAVYRSAADALGFPVATASTMDASVGRLDRQAAVGVSVLVHSLALHAQLRAAGRVLPFVAYTGESFGILTAAVAAGALSIADGTRVAHAFTPLALLCAGERDGGRVRDRLLRHIPEAVRDRPVVSEPHHVIGLRAATGAELAAVLAGSRARFSIHDVEPHKRYSPRQCNVYVRAGAYAPFLAFVRATHPGIEVVELKEPTIFVAHSERMRPARAALADFLVANGIEFTDPRVPVVSNSGSGLLRSAEAVRKAVLDMTDAVMDSQGTCVQLDSLDLDAVLELGPGGKSIELLHDNNVTAVVRAAPMTAEDAERFAQSVTAIDDLLDHLNVLQWTDGAVLHLPVLRQAIKATAVDEIGRAVLCGRAARLASAQVGPPHAESPPAFTRGVEMVQHTLAHGDRIRSTQGDVVVRARLRKTLSAELPPVPTPTRLELTVTGADGRSFTRWVDTDLPEVQVVHLGRRADADDATYRRWLRQLVESGQRAPIMTPEPTGDELAILCQYLVFQAIADRRPALLAHADVCLHAGDRVGGLAALAASGALTITDVLAAHREDVTIDAVAERVGPATVPIVSPAGVPVRSRREMRAILRAALGPARREAGPSRLRLNGSGHVLSLGPDVRDDSFDTGPHAISVLTASDPDTVRLRAGSALDRYERECLLRLTREHALVLATATSRRITLGTVNAYVDAAESVVGFGEGGSESMTIFVREDGADKVTVRKVLSEALTTAPWDPQGTGVMLPPFAKARKQAEFLDGLPPSVRPYFPRVFETRERTIHAPVGESSREYRSTREVVYEMSYLGGEEVSGFVRRWSPPPAVVARLYEQIIRLLRECVHSERRTVPSGETLETSYFRKIEDRLDLCRRTAPVTFGPALLDSEHIVINGVPYLNSAALLRRFRGDPRFRRALEPRYHSLVVGDTNTENIKIGDPSSLRYAQWVIENDGSATDVAAALRAITLDALDLRFLDPRAIGFDSDGSATRDDPMYDNKPWHNSLGHYDEIHFEHFELDVDLHQPAPRVSIRFDPDNPYSRSYQVRDVNANGGRVDPGRPRGLEDHFAPVMAAAFDLGDPYRSHERDDPFWLVRFVFMMGQHFTAMPPFHFKRELDGTLLDDPQDQRRPVAIYCEGVKWLNWSLQMLDGGRTEFLGIPVALPDELRQGAHRTEESTVA